MSSSGPINYYPEITVLIDPLLGRLPLTVTFSATATDSDGTIQSYEWDFEGDGTYDWNSDSDGNTSHIYDMRGTYSAACRVTDNLGLAQIISEGISVLGPGDPTEVSGQIPFNTTWEKSLSPYLLTGDVQVPSDVTLTIEPGVEVQYSGAYEILVQGSIIANGTSQDSIIFTSTSSGVSSNATQLRFDGTVLDNSQFSYLRMDYAANAIQLGKETEHNQGDKNSGTLNVSYVRLDNAGIFTDGYDTGAKIVLTNAVITSCTIKGNYPRSEEIIIRNADLTNCIINSDSYNKGITLENSNVTGTEFTIGCCGANFKILNCTIEASSFSDYNDYYSVVIRDSRILNTPILLGQSESGFTLFNTTIDYSGLSGNITCLECNNLQMDSSFIIGNNSGTGIILTGNNNTITNSSISNTGIGIKLNSGTLTVNNCSFSNNGTFNVENRTDGTVDATENWWGTIDAAEINAKIFDKFNDINYGQVIFNPIKMSPSGPINYFPEATVSIDPLLGRIPLAVNFNATAIDSDGTIEKYEWDFDEDGTYDWSSSENGNTKNLYMEGGQYKVELKVTDSTNLANRLFYNLAALDFKVNVEQKNEKIVVGWGWGEFSIVVIPSSCLDFLSDGDELHIIDSAGIINNYCPVEIGELLTGSIRYINGKDSTYIVQCQAAIDLSSFNGTAHSGYLKGNRMIFKIKVAGSDSVYEILPVTSNSEQAVFDDSLILSIISFTDKDNKHLPKRKMSNNVVKKSKILQNVSSEFFNIYKNGELIKSYYPSSFFVDNDVKSNTSYKYEIFLLDSNGNEILAKYDSIQTNDIVADSYRSSNILPNKFFITTLLNPFQGKLAIKFGLPSNEIVYAAMYDPLGRMLAMLPKNFKKAGYHRIEWVLPGIASGRYIIIFKAGKYSKTLILTLSK